MAAFTGELGTSASGLGNIQLGLGPAAAGYAGKADGAAAVSGVGLGVALAAGQADGGCAVSGRAPTPAAGAADGLAAVSGALAAVGLMVGRADGTCALLSSPGAAAVAPKMSVGAAVNGVWGLTARAAGRAAARAEGYYRLAGVASPYRPAAPHTADSLRQQAEAARVRPGAGPAQADVLQRQAEPGVVRPGAPALDTGAYQPRPIEAE